MPTDVFFDESTEQSRVKAAITNKYFWSWAKIIAPRAKNRGTRLAYIDLFAGPGRYKDGSLSTPLLVLKTALEMPDLHDRLITVFNDRDPEAVSALREAVASLEGISSLHHEPRIICEEVGAEIVAQFEKMRLMPTLMFVDPWGYKGLSLRLVQSVLQNWGCDCIFFFNYNRINMGLSNPLVEEHMSALFGDERAAALSATLGSLSPAARELAIVEQLVTAHQEYGATYVLPFRFRNEHGTRTSHHLIFATKNFTAYHIMKDIMAGESSLHVDGVASFEYSAADERFPRLFALTSPLAALGPELLAQFAGRTRTVEQIYREHSVGRPFVKRNYKNLLMQLEQEGAVTAMPSREARRAGTMGDTVRVRFPDGG